MLFLLLKPINARNAAAAFAVVCPAVPAHTFFSAENFERVAVGERVALSAGVVDVKQDCAGVCHFVAVNGAEMLAAVQGERHRLVFE